MKVKLVPATIDVDLYAGDGEAVEIACVDAAGLAVDVSDRTWSAQWRPTPASADVEAIALTVDAAAAATGIVVVHFSAATTRAQMAQSGSLAGVAHGVWDLQGTVTGADPQTLARGQTTTILDVTR